MTLQLRYASQKLLMVAHKLKIRKIIHHQLVENYITWVSLKLGDKLEEPTNKLINISYHSEVVEKPD